MNLALCFLILLICPFALIGGELYQSDAEKLEEESERIRALSREFAKFYDLPPDVDMLDITEDLLKSPYVKDAQKQLIQTFNRRVLVFSYLSDGLKIKGVVSFVPDPENHPLLVYLRGGNRLFAVPNPGGDLMLPEQYTVISSMYRGGVSEGVDEYGGDDVNDVKNLIEFIPELEAKIGINVRKQKIFLLGASRGGMQMFLALARFPELQTYFAKIVSLSGLLDMHACIASRPDIEDMLIKDFGLVKGEREEEWINKRDPLLTVDFIRQQLPILVIQGTADLRVGLESGYHMVNQLQAAGHDVTYWEIDGASHCLSNREDRMKLIIKWLEE